MRSVNKLLVLSLLAWSSSGHAQLSLLDSTHVVVDSGTVLRITGPTTLILGDATDLLNNGLILLDPAAAIQEPEGHPIHGSGTEHIAQAPGAPLTFTDHGGLGWSMNTAVPVDSVVVIRGHGVFMDTAGRRSVARWFNARTIPSSGLNATVRMRFDLTELDTLSEVDLALHRPLSGDTIWIGLASSVNTAQHHVSSMLVDTLGLFALFENFIPTSIEKPTVRGPAQVYPSPANASVTVVTEHRGDGWVRLIDASGAIARVYPVVRWSGPVSFDLSGIAPGAYFILFQDGQWASFIRS